MRLDPNQSSIALAAHCGSFSTWQSLQAFGVPSFPQSSPSPPGEIGRYYRYAPSVEIINGGYVWHSDQETAETISANGLAAVTRTYAKVIADTDVIDLKEMRQAIAAR